MEGGSDQQVATSFPVDPVEPLAPVDPVDPVVRSKKLFFVGRHRT